MSDKPKPCPFCGSKAIYKKITWCANYDDAGHHWWAIREMPAESIECGNYKCAIRPKMIRVNTGDAIQKWNTRTPSNTASTPTGGSAPVAGQSSTPENIPSILADTTPPTSG